MVNKSNKNNLLFWKDFFLTLFGIYFLASCSLPLSDNSTKNNVEAISRSLTSNTVYYVDSTNGNDSNDGVSTSSPWKSLLKANSVILQPGDSLLFKAGGEWTGQLLPKGSGNSNGQIIISSYGSGAKPLFNGGGTTPTNDGTYNYSTGTIQLYNQEYITIDGLAVTNVATPNVSIRDGIKVSIDETQIFHNIQITNNEVYNIGGQNSRETGKYNDMYANGAIHIWAQGTMNDSYHYDNILIKGNYIHDVDTSGIRIHNRDDYPVIAPFNTNVLVDSNIISRTGSDGMIIANCNSPVIKYNQVLYSGSRSIPETRIIAGAWVCSSIGGLFQHNEVAYTKLLGSDGTAFDTDWGVSGTVIYEYNYTHDNEGGVWLDCSGIVSQPNYVKTIYRYNVSVNEGISLFRSSGAKYAEIYNNVFRKTSGTYIMDHNSTGSNHKYWNNIFNFENAPDWQSSVYVNNLYYPCIANSNDEEALSFDPQFINPGESVDGISNADNYKLKTTSPAINKGITISGSGFSFPWTDFWGNSVPKDLMDIGAYEYPVAPTTPIISGNKYKIFNLGSAKILGISNSSTYNGAAINQQMDNDSPDHVWTIIKNSDGTYKILNNYSGKVIGIQSMSTYNGASILQWDDNGTRDHDWILESKGGNSYKFISAHSSKAIGISASGLSAGTPAIQWTSGDIADQVFVLVPVI